MGLGRVNSRFVFAIILIMFFTVGWPTKSDAQFTSFASGDIVAGIGYGKYNVFDPSGHLLTTLDTTTGSTEDTGGAFDADGNLFVTNFQANSVSEFNIHGSLVTATFGSGYNFHPESITLDGTGNIYVGQADGTGSALEFSPSGTPLNNYTPAREDRGTDWITLGPDGKTLYYTSEGKSIKRFDILTNTQLSDFVDNLPGPYAYALKVLPDGNVLVADTDRALLIDTGGNILHTYTASGATLLFAINVLPSGRSFIVGDHDSGQIYQFNIATGVLENQFSSQKQTTLAGLIVFGEPSQSAEFKIYGGAFLAGQEPSVAADPNDSMHAVVGFNKRAFYVVSCGWAESRDGGQTWNSGSISFPTGFHGMGDPWVRYAPDGELFYTCMGETDWHRPGLNPFFKTRQVGVFAAVSGTGLASDFEVAQPVDVVQQFCTGLFCDQGLPGSELTDHPAFSIVTQGSNHRLVACWVDSFSHPGSNYVKVAISDDGRTWSHVKALAAGNETACTVGGNSSEAAVAWLDRDKGAGNLKYKLSQDGIKWSQTTVLSSAGSLVNGLSTTASVLSVPFALVIPGGNGLTALWQWRNSVTSMSQVSTRSITPLSNDLKVLGDPKIEKFLPGGGTCGDAVGTYYGSASGLFRYTVWRLQSSDAIPLFLSTTPFNSAAGIDDPNYPGFKRIGDYTGVDCSGHFVWTAWTDLRNNRQEIWGARILLPKP